MKNICLVCACLVRVVQRFSAWNTFVDVWRGKKYPTLLLSDDTLASSNNIHSVRWMSYGIDEVIAIIIIIWYSRGLKLSLSLCLLVGVCMQFHNWKCKKRNLYIAKCSWSDHVFINWTRHVAVHVQGMSRVECKSVIYFTAWQWVEVRTSCIGMHWL